jgi:hypothetical protein
MESADFRVDWLRSVGKDISCTALLKSVCVCVCVCTCAHELMCIV